MRIISLAIVMFSLSAASAADVFSVRTLPAVEGLKTSVTAQRTGDEWKIAVSAENRTPTNVVFKLVLAAEPRIPATHYLIPGVLYNGNEFVGKSIPSDGRAFSLDMPNGWQKDGQPWIFAYDRCSIPSCTISENEKEVFALFASDGDQKSHASACSMEKLADGSFRHLIYWPVTEAPVSYTDKRTFTERYDTSLTLAPGETFRADAFACRGTPPWPNYGFAAVFPVAWRNLKHETKAQKTMAETIRLDRAFHTWCHRRNAEGSWFSGGHNDKTFLMGYLNIPKSKEGYTLADYGRDNTLGKWCNDDLEKSKQLKPGEYLEGAGANDIGFASQSFQKARVTIAYGLADGNADDVAFGLEVLRSWIRSRQRPSGLFRRGRPPKPGKTFTDASEVGWAIGELSRTAMLLKEKGRDGSEFAEAAKKVVDVVLRTLPGDGGLGSQWDFETGKLINQSGDCGGFVLMGLVRYWRMLVADARGGDARRVGYEGEKIRAVIDRAFDYYFSRDIDRFECNGGAMDCASVDREGMQPFLSAAVEMWQATHEARYHERARKAAWYFLSWVYLQNPIYGPDLDLSVFNWRPAGSTIVGTEHPALDDYGCLVISELIKLAKEEKTPLFRDVAALMWRNGTQGFAFEGREVFHALERPIGSKQEAWFPTRWSKYRVGELKRGSLNDHLMAWGGTYRLASLQQLDEADRTWLASVSPVETEVTLSNQFGTARIELRGANMRSWRPKGGREVLGTLGVPIYWPWAIREGAPGCEIHGLTPYFDWKVKERTADRVVLALDDDESTRRVWPHAFHAEMEYRLGGKLEVVFRVTNTGSEAYSCTELLHPFFRVSHPKNCRIGGVDGAKYFWKAEAEKGADRVWKGAFPVKKIAGGKPGIVFERGDGAFTLVDVDRRVTAKFHGGVKFVSYVAPDGSVSMETGTIYRDRAYTLQPGETHEVGVVIGSAFPGVPKQGEGAARVGERICWNGNFPDPTLWKGVDGKFYAYATPGSRLLEKPYLVSGDGVSWKSLGHGPFSRETAQEVHRRWKMIWAPDHATVAGTNLLYVSLVNSDVDSAIGVFRLTGDEPGEARDLRIVTHSKETGIVDTIDPEVVTDPATGRVWLFFGSTGRIHRVELKADGLAVKPGAKCVPVAGRSVVGEKNRERVFEGAYLLRHGDWWYLFVSGGWYDDASYCLRVGRSRTLEGQFLDREGRPTTEGFGTRVLGSEGDFFGPGHNGDVLVGTDGVARMYYHSHWKQLGEKGRHTRILLARRLEWDAMGWPRLVRDQ